MLPWMKPILLADPDADKLVIYHSPLGSLTFDPSLTTSVSTTVAWSTEAGITETTGTTHNFSYTPTAGPKKCTVTVRGGLGLVTGIDCQADSITSIKNINSANKAATITCYTNPSLAFFAVPPSVTTFKNSACLVAGTPLSLLLNVTSYDIGGACYGTFSQFNRLATMIYCAGNLSAVTGTLVDLPAVLQIGWFYNSTGITAASIDHLVAIRDLRIYLMGWNAANVDTVLLSASDAVWLDANHYTYGGAGTGPSLRIDSNAVPGGSVGADTTDPAVTPGNGNSNADWQWIDTAHKALTGKAAVWYLTHLATHTWAVVYQVV
jgi:hypothetical protein